MSTAERSLEIQLLGELSVRRDGAVVRLPQSKKARALLGYLILTGRPQRRERLCSLLWDVVDDPRGALRWCLSKLRPLVNEPGATRIVTKNDAVVFDPSGARIDLMQARDAVRAGVAQVDTESLLAIADSYRGELLEGLEMSDFGEFQAWCVAQRESARALRARVLRELVERLRATPDRALPHARALVQIEPVDERVRAQLVELLAAAGRLGEAEQQREIGARQLRELGVEPGGALSAAGTSQRGGGQPSPAAEARPGDAAPVVVDDGALIGRRAERARLAKVLESVLSDGSERVVLISGEPGVGKTRLLVSLLDRVRESGGTVLDGRAFEAERGRPFGPWIDALRGGPLQSWESREQMFTAVVERITSRERPPVAIAIDDVQWIDEASAELLHYVARQTRAHPLLIALTARTGEIVDNAPMQGVLRSLRKERLLEDLEVGPLSRDDTAALVSAVAPGADARLVFERSAGNPLYALELARSGPRDDGKVPGTIADVVRSRIDGLSSEAADVLRWAAVCGPTTPVALLSELLSLGADELMTALELLERHALVHADGDAYSFSHDVVRRAVYDELSEPRRRLMHRKIAAALRTREAADESVVADVAHHASLAGDAAMAAAACAAAGRRSLKMFAKRDALALARRGARYCAELPEPERTTAAIDLWEVRIGAEIPEDVEAVGRELEELAERAMDAGRFDHARLGFHLLGHLIWTGGRSADALQHMLAAEHLTRGAEGPERAAALAEAARCLVLLDRDHAQAQALVLEARALATRSGVKPVALPDTAGMLRSHQGGFDEAAELFRESQHLARLEQDRFGEFQALEHLIMLELQRGNCEEARQLAARLSILGDRMRQGSEGPCARALAALADYACGDEAAMARFESAADELRAVDAKQRLAFALLVAAERELGRGEVAATRRFASEALTLATRIDRRSDIAWARALIARAADDPEERRDHVQALREHAGAPLAAHVRTVVDDVLEETGGEEPGT